ncbi:MAG: amidophosphoribosyltransferase [Acidobacteriota bacterium]|nr:amidophosphoribosyltransferase [Acidobacteriota bacterium]
MSRGPVHRPSVREGGSSSLRDKCGVAAVLGHPEAANLVYLALYALQHRGQESAGIVTSDGPRLRRYAGMGNVADVFTPEILEDLIGTLAIGHVRYGTSGWSTVDNAQPLRMTHQRGPMALAHNGNLVNALTLRDRLQKKGSIFRTTSDTEVIFHLVAHSSQQTLEDALAEALNQVEGAFSLVVADRERVIAVRDPRGFRPLSLGRLPDGQPVVASETCAFDLIGARFERDVAPGEMLVLGPHGEERSFRPFAEMKPQPCLFEYVYFSRPDSFVFGRSVGEVRRALGRELAREAPVDADLVVPVPDSGVPAAIGYSRESGLPFDHGLVRNHYVGRTFIEPAQTIRHFGVKIKLNPVRSIIAGRRIVLVDDSLVRGTTMAKIVHMVREAGALSIHVRISCPPTISPCYYGIDTPTKAELIGSHKSVDEIRTFIEADSLAYLSREGMCRAAGTEPERFCTSCWTGDYPVPPTDSPEIRDEMRLLDESVEELRAPLSITRENKKR